MPERPNTVKVDASSVQGEGAYVEWRRMTWGERREAMAAIANDKAKAIDFFFGHFAGWNWVDSDGNPLPLPETGYEEEVKFLTDVSRRAITGELEYTPEAEKN